MGFPTDNVHGLVRARAHRRLDRQWKEDDFRIRSNGSAVPRQAVYTGETLAPIIKPMSKR